MIKQINIKNFQSHKDSTLEFSDDLTCIVGLNNHGKSVIFRALQKCIRNIPDGKSFITDTPTQEKECNVTVVSDEGVVIRKVKNDNSSNANMYVIDREGTLEEYVKFGRTGIPEEILTCLPTSPPQIFGDVEIDLNFANQLDALFLMVGMGLPALRGKVLGKASGVDKVQRAITIGSSEGKKLKNTISNFKSQQVEIDTKLLFYKDLDDQLLQITICVNKLLLIDEDKVCVEKIQKSKDRVHAIVVEANVLQEVISKLELTDILQVKKDLAATYNMYDKLVKIGKLKIGYDIVAAEEKEIVSLLPVIEELNVFLRNTNTLLSRLLKFQQIVNQLNAVNSTLPFIDEGLPNLLQEQEDLKIKKEYYIKVVFAINNVSATKQKLLVLDPEIYGLEKQEQKAEFELELYRQEIKVCPTCNRPWNI